MAFAFLALAQSVPPSRNHDSPSTHFRTMGQQGYVLSEAAKERPTSKAGRDSTDYYPKERSKSGASLIAFSLSDHVLAYRATKRNTRHGAHDLGPLSVLSADCPIKCRASAGARVGVHPPCLARAASDASRRHLQRPRSRLKLGMSGTSQYGRWSLGIGWGSGRPSPTRWFSFPLFAIVDPPVGGELSRVTGRSRRAIEFAVSQVDNDSVLPIS